MSQNDAPDYDSMIRIANLCVHNLRIVARHVGDARREELVQAADDLVEMAAFLQLVAATPYPEMSPRIARIMLAQIDRAWQLLKADGIKELFRRFGEIPF